MNDDIVIKFNNRLSSVNINMNYINEKWIDVNTEIGIIRKQCLYHVSIEFMSVKSMNDMIMNHKDQLILCIGKSVQNGTVSYELSEFALSVKEYIDLHNRKRELIDLFIKKAWESECIYKAYNQNIMSKDIFGKVKSSFEYNTDCFKLLDGILKLHVVKPLLYYNLIQEEQMIKRESRNRGSIEGMYAYNPKNTEYLSEYLDEIDNVFRFSSGSANKNVLGGVCLVLLEKKICIGGTEKYIFKTTTSFSKLILAIAEYYGIDPPKDKRNNKYQEAKNELIKKYSILERALL